jgi:hypothetical protein
LEFYYNEKTPPIYDLLKKHNVGPHRKLFTFSHASWQDDWDNGRITGGYLVYYMGGVFKQSSNMLDPMDIISAEYEYNEASIVSQ